MTSKFDSLFGTLKMPRGILLEIYYGSKTVDQKSRLTYEFYGKTFTLKCSIASERILTGWSNPTSRDLNGTVVRFRVYKVTKEFSSND